MSKSGKHDSRLKSLFRLKSKAKEDVVLPSSKSGSAPSSSKTATATGCPTQNSGVAPVHTKHRSAEETVVGKVAPKQKDDASNSSDILVQRDQKSPAELVSPIVTSNQRDDTLISEDAPAQSSTRMPADSKVSKAEQLDDPGVLPNASDESDTWRSAYEALAKQSPELVNAVESHMANLTGNLTLRLNSPQDIDEVVTSTIKKKQDSQMMIKILDHPINVREKLEKACKFVVWAKDYIDIVAGANPYSALAWSCVSAVLPLLLNASDQNAAMAAGLDTITLLLRRYSIREDLYLKSNQNTFSAQFRSEIVILYTNILDYQFSMLAHLGKKTLSRAVADVLKSTDWTGKLDTVKKFDDQCGTYIDSMQLDEERGHFNTQAAMMHESLARQDEMIKGLREQQNLMAKVRSDTAKARLDDKMENFLSILAGHYEDDKNYNPTRVEGTCNWFFEDLNYKQWYYKESSALLWVAAGPGCGKSVLSRTLIDERRLSPLLTTQTTCYFFFKDGNTKRTRLEHALSALLYQFLEQHQDPDMFKYCLPNNMGDQLRDSTAKLWDILLKCTSDSMAGETVCVLDALDECETESADALFGLLKSLFTPSRASRLKFLITGRPHLRIQDEISILKGATDMPQNVVDESQDHRHFVYQIDLDKDANSDSMKTDIELLIERKVKDMGSIGILKAEEARRSLAESLKRRSERTYLWLYLAFERLKSNPSALRKRNGIEELLKQIPDSVMSAYNKALQEREDEKLTRNILSILLAAARPLTILELNYALTMAECQGKDKVSHMELHSLLVEDFPGYVADNCGLLVSIYQGTFNFIHQTVRDFLTEHVDDSKGSWQGSIPSTLAHQRLAKICMDYLDLEGMSTVEEHESRCGTRFVHDMYRRYEMPLDEEYNPKGFFEEYPLLIYASKYWPLHHTTSDDDSQDLRARIMCGQAYRRCSPWLVVASKRPEHGYSNEESDEMWAACSVGAGRVVDVLLREGVDPTAKLKPRDTSLVVAAAFGHLSIVDKLLATSTCSFDILTTNQAFWQSVDQQQDAVFRRLLKVPGIDVNFSLQQPVLMRAIENKRWDMARILVERGADVQHRSINSFDKFVPIVSASEAGPEDFIRLLWERGADPNKRYLDSITYHRNGVHLRKSETWDYSPNALEAACKKPNITVMKFLLREKLVSPNATDGGLSRAFLLAASLGHDQAMRILIDHGACAYTVQGPFITVLDMVIAVGRTDMFSAICDKVDIRKLASMSSEPRAKVPVKELPLDHVVRLKDARDLNVGGPLHCASHFGRLGYVSSLLNAGLNPHQITGRYGTALQAACVESIWTIEFTREEFGSRSQTARLLIDHKADPRIVAEESDFGDALHAACCSGDDSELVTMLLDSGADANSTLRSRIHVFETDRVSCTPLQVAARNAGLVCVEILLDRGADIQGYTVGSDAGPPLELAAWNGHREMVKTLIRRGADVHFEAATSRHGTALHAAVESSGSSGVIEALLDCGADPNHQVQLSAQPSPLYLACSMESPSLVDAAEILLKHGAHPNFDTEMNEYGTALGGAAARGRCEEIRALIRHGADVNLESAHGPYRTPLIAAAAKLKSDAIETLLELGADIDQRVSGGKASSALEAALMSSMKELDSLKRQSETVRSRWAIEAVILLLEKGANRDGVDNETLETVDSARDEDSEDTDSSGGTD